MSETSEIDLRDIRTAMAGFEISPRVEPNEPIDLERVFFPDGHRSVLDVKRQLVVGNRGMGKSFWTHALTNPAVREQLARTYSFPKLANTEVVIGFNGSIKISGVSATIEDIQSARNAGNDPALIWRAVILRAVGSQKPQVAARSFSDTLNSLKYRSSSYSQQLSELDDLITERGSSILVVFDALDRLANDWGLIREMTKGLLRTVVDLQSFRSIRAKVFMRIDQFADAELFHFPDASKIRNDRVDLKWYPNELYGLLIFELKRQAAAALVFKELEASLRAGSIWQKRGEMSPTPREQELLVNAIAGEFMGKDRKRGRVYTWVPLHLGDAANNCSPRTFLTAWKTAAEHTPSPQGQAVDHLGINEGVRRASSARLTELREDYPWIDLVLEPLRRQFVPIPKNDLFQLWQEKDVTQEILRQTKAQQFLAPIGVFLNAHSLDALLQTMTSIAVMEERANGKINVPDIFRVEAQILRKGGVAVPRKH